MSEETQLKSYRILFFGSPEFAIPSLRALMESPDREDKVIGVVAQPDRPKGRGRKLTPPPVKVLAQQYNLPVYQPETVKDPAFLKEVEKIAPDLLVVAAFGQILPKALLEIPPLGGINVHPSLLPKYRGAAPINWTLIRGETVTGVTIMRLSPRMDSGDILFQRAMFIEPEDTFGSLHDKLAIFGAEMLLETLHRMKRGMLAPIPQDDNLATYAPKLKKEDALIDWGKSAQEIANLIRGLDPWPGAYTYLNGKILKLFRPQVISLTPQDISPGTVLDVNPEGIQIATKQGILVVKEVQLEGRKRLTVREFIKGQSNLIGKRLGEVRSKA
ncbi:MAG: methionyl-tRNA formyltransferase [Candidatus Desulfofervidaceae bacterium]|nr:methionyl-tRNA formyltransferase [Candidatus Desulfofervidaceae bacterium]